MSETDRWETGAGGFVRLALAAAVVGVAVGIGIRIFKWMIAGAEWLAYGWRVGSWTEVGAPWVVLIPVVGGVVVGLILHLTATPEDPGHGVAEVIEAVTLGTEDFPERQTPVKATVAAISLGAGAALGPEDPAVEIGASVGHFAGRTWGYSPDSVQALVAVGGSAGLAAAFHAPIAAVVFAVEVFALRPVSRALGLVVVGVVSAYAVTRSIAPVAEPSMPPFGLGSGWELLLSVGLGVLAGVLSAGLIRLMYGLEFAVIRLRTVPRWSKPVLGGLVLGLSGLALPELLGIGYATLEPVLAGADLDWTLLLVLAIGKALLMAVSFGSGFLGGFFAPSLLIGATLGGAYGTLLAGALPGLSLSAPLFAAAGMAAVLAGAVRAPLSAVLLILALSGDYSVAPLLLVAAMAGHWTSRAMVKHSLYTYGVGHREATGATGRAPDQPHDPVAPRGPQSDVDGRADDIL